MSFTPRRFAVWLLALGAMGLACADRALAADPALTAPPPVDRNLKLRIQLDRTTIRANEPVYLCLTAEQFAAGDVDIQISKDKGPYAPAKIDPKSWAKAELSNGPRKLPTRRMGAMLLAQTVDGKRSFL